MKHAAILGYGVVGSGVAEVVEMNSTKLELAIGEPIRIKKILDIRDFPGDPFEGLLTKEADEVFEDAEISIVAETIGGARIAYEFTKRALAKGKTVVTSNKELVSTHGVELMKLAKENGCSYLFEAAVGGGIPIIRPMHRCLTGNQITAIAGIVNGTTNYILTQMANTGKGYQEALAEAQQKGYAEQNPSADIDGVDAKRKLAILSTIALDGAFVNSQKIHAEGIAGVSLNDIAYAKALDGKVKLLALFSRPEGQEKCRCVVAPHLLSNSSPLAVADDVFNAVMVTGNAVGDVMFYGQGAGKLATASAVVGDMVEAASQESDLPATLTWYVANREVLADFASSPVKALVRVGKSVTAEAVEKAFHGVSCEPVVANVIDGEKGYLVGLAQDLTEGVLADGLAGISDLKGWIRLCFG